MKIKVLTLLGAIVALSSCSIDNKICKQATRREINRAMSYSSWEYVMPNHPIYITVSSN